MGETTDKIEEFIAAWRDTGGSELANTQSFVNGLCDLIGVPTPDGSKAIDTENDYVFERRVFAHNGDGTTSFGRIDCYRRGAFILEAKQGSDADRRAAEAGEEDLDLFGQSAARRMKRGTARRGTGGWTAAMIGAKGQAERYARSLPVDHDWPPFLIVTDVGYCLDIWADFSGTGRAYTQFPDRARYRIMLEDLRDPEVRERLRCIWTDPFSLDPAAKAARVTRQIADLLAKVAKRLEARDHNPERVSGFLMRLLFTMFAEDSKLIPEESFTGLLKAQRQHPEHLAPQLSALWQAMDQGEFAPALGVPVKKFNGYLFKDRTALDLEANELEVLIQAAEHKWTEVEPAIFGTLLERALNPKERAKLGAHYTPRAYVERLIAPTIMEPLRGDWDGVRTAAASLIDDGKTDAARLLVEQFHTRLAGTRVLDPACGTGNFLYVAMARMKELEGEVLELLEELSSSDAEKQYVADLTGHTITPENFLGLEINPRAVEIAQLVLWIGYLQWHFRVNGQERMPNEPILTGLRTIEHRDALIEYDEKVLERDEENRPVSRWDGETSKPHPVTGKPVPDETARVESWRYLNPRAAKWPTANFIVGNPPFIGSKRMREQLSDGYFEALRTVYHKLPGDTDFVFYWVWRGASLVASEEVRRSGLITTNTLRQTVGQRMLAAVMSGKKRTSLVFAVADHPWRDAQTDAAVRVAMTVFARGEVDGLLLQVDDDGKQLASSNGLINNNLTVGVNISKAVALKANANMSFMGVKLAGAGFRLSESERTAFAHAGANLNMMPRLVAGSDVTTRDQHRYVIDAFGLSARELESAHPALFQHLVNTVQPGRMTLRRKSYRDLWWVFAEPRPAMRKAIDRLDRVIVTSEVSKHPTFVFEATDGVQFDGSVIVVASDDAFHLGILSSRIHETWKHNAGGTLEDRPRYQVGKTFDPFPFPADVPEQLVNKVRTEAVALDALRKRVLAEHDDLTLTKLYNVLDALRSGSALTDIERDIHDRGLVTLIRRHHDAIDIAVAEAYGWPADMSEEEILARLVALNRERASEESRGLIRYLRPEFQDPGYQAPINERLDLGETAAPLPDNIITWPNDLPGQIGAVQSILSSSPEPLAAQDIARAFKGKRVATIRPVLDALAGVGLARRTAEGKYAA